MKNIAKKLIFITGLFSILLMSCEKEYSEWWREDKFNHVIYDSIVEDSITLYKHTRMNLDGTFIFRFADVTFTGENIDSLIKYKDRISHEYTKQYSEVYNKDTIKLYFELDDNNKHIFVFTK